MQVITSLLATSLAARPHPSTIFFQNSFGAFKSGVLYGRNTDPFCGFYQHGPVVKIKAFLCAYLGNTECQLKNAGIWFAHGYFRGRDKSIKAAVQSKFFNSVII